jgi:hypothetical protein
VFHSILHHVHLPCCVIALVGGHKGEVEIAHVVVDSSPARAAAHQVASVGFEPRKVALSVGVLVLPNHYGAAVPPKVQNHSPIQTLGEKVVLNSNVEVRVELVTDYNLRHDLNKRL